MYPNIEIVNMYNEQFPPPPIESELVYPSLEIVNTISNLRGPVVQPRISEYDLIIYIDFRDAT